MSWLLWLFALLVAYSFLSDFIKSRRCGLHGEFGRCRRCELEAAARLRAEAKARAEAARRRMEIEETFKTMDQAKRNELTALVKARAQREDLLLRPGDLEAAVVRMYEKAQTRQSRQTTRDAK
jgi:hypothetical protein